LALLIHTTTLEGVTQPARLPEQVSYVMRNLNAERAGMDVHLSSPAPVSVPSGYHKILKPVKESNRPHDLGGRWAATKVWER